jgi:flagellar protein FliJ
MKARDNALRLRRHVVEEMNRKVSELDRIIREFDTMAADLDRQIQAEEDRTGVRDRSHFAYSTYARSAAQRRDNLKTSTEGMREQLEAAIRERDDAAEQFARASAQFESREESRIGRRKPEKVAGADLR